MGEHPTAGRSLHLVSPELRPVLAAWPTVNFTAELLPEFRQRRAPEDRLPPPAPQPSERLIPGAPDNPDLRVLMFDPSPGTTGRAALLHLHGGGYVVGSPDNAIRGCQRYAAECGCVIVSVDYRLAPETPFPGALEDNYAALRWLHANASILGVDPARIGVGGESAGGGHAAALALVARDRGEIPVAFQFLVYPMLDDRTGSTREVSPFIGEYIWTAVSNRFGWSALLGVAAGSSEVPAGAVPARTLDLSGLPPTYIATGALDIFLEEDLEYARRLIGSGVPVDLEVISGAYHGFDVLAPEAAVSTRFTARLVDGLRRRLAAPLMTP